jgi:nucleoid DNA-binding protein
MDGSKMKRKKDLDRAVATQLGYPVFVIRRITATFVDQFTETLCKDGEFHLDEFGGFSVTVAPPQKVPFIDGNFKKNGRVRKVLREIPFKIRVEFRKATPLKRALQVVTERKLCRAKTTKKV